MQNTDLSFSMVLRRRITGIVMAVCLIALWAIQGWPIRILFVALLAMSVWEVYAAFYHKGIRPVRWAGMAFAALAMPSYLIFGIASFAPLVAICAIIAFVVMACRGKLDYEATLCSIFPIVYPGLFYALLFPLQDLSSPMISTVAMGQAFLIANMNDLMAYEIGVKFGRRKFAPHLSPKKTVEGAIGGMVGSVTFAVLIPLAANLVCTYMPIAQPYLVPLPPYWQFAILGLFGGAAAQVGDLAASMLKRYCGVKDFGWIFPGHGGMMDRMDSVLGAAVMVHIFYIFFV